MGLYDLLTLYAQYHPQLKQSTAETYRYAIRSLERFLGRTPTVADLSESVFLAFVRCRLGQGGAQTVRRDGATLFRFWKFAWRRHLTPANPNDADLPRITVPREPPLALSPEELRRLLESCREERGLIRSTSVNKAAWWRALVLALYGSGGRVGAVLAMRQADIDYATGWCHLAADSAKTSAGQYVQLPPEAVRAIQAMHWGGEMVFPKPYQRRWLWTAWKRILRRAGLPPDRYHAFHAIRRTTATLAAVNGSIDLARQALGHTREAMTRRYLDPRFCGQSLVGVLPRVC